MSHSLPAHSSGAQVDSHDKSEKSERSERFEIQPVTFINHDAEHLQITSRDLKSINSHINSHIHAHITRRSDEEKESLVPSSPLNTTSTVGSERIPSMRSQSLKDTVFQKHSTTVSSFIPCMLLYRTDNLRHQYFISLSLRVRGLKTPSSECADV
jgi:hypothetical protein